MINQLNAEVLAISADSIASHQRFAEKLGGISFPMLSDAEKHVAALYGVLNEKGTGAKRALFVIGKDGIVYHANPKYELAKTAQYDAAVQALRDLATH